MTIVYRGVKGAPLSHSEMDGNFSHLNLKTANGWADIVADLTTRSGTAAPGVSQYKGGIYLYEFSSTDTLEVYSQFHIPHSWKLGSMLYPHLHFVTTSNLSGVVRIGFEYTAANRHDHSVNTAFGATQTITVDFNIPANSADKHFVCEAPELGGIPGTNLDVDAMVLCRIFREASHPNDTFDASIWGITADLHIEVDKASTPFRAPDFMVGP